MQILCHHSTLPVSNMLGVSFQAIYTALDLFTGNNWIIVSQGGSVGEWFFSFNCFALAVIKFRFIPGKFWAGRSWICIRFWFVLLPETIRISPFDKHSPPSHWRRFHWTQWGFRERCSYGSNGQDFSLRGPPSCVVHSVTVCGASCSCVVLHNKRVIVFDTLQFCTTNRQRADVFNFGRISYPVVGYTAGSLSVCIRVFPRPVISAQVFLVFLLSSRKCWEGSQVPSCYAKPYTQPLPIQFHGI